MLKVMSRRGRDDLSKWCCWLSWLVSVGGGDDWRWGHNDYWCCVGALRHIQEPFRWTVWERRTRPRETARSWTWMTLCTSEDCLRTEPASSSPQRFVLSSAGHTHVDKCRLQWAKICVGEQKLYPYLFCLEFPRSAQFQVFIIHSSSSVKQPWMIKREKPLIPHI